MDAHRPQQVDLASYRKTVHDPFAPKRRSGDPGYGDLSLASVWAQENWRLGFGHDWWEPGWSNREAGFDLGVGIDARFGDLRLGRSLLTVYNPGSGTTTNLNELAVYNGKLFATNGSGQQVFESSDGVAWSTSVNTGDAGLRAMAIFNGRLIVGSTDGSNLYKYDGSAWTSPWVTLTGTKPRGMAVYPINGTDYLFVGAAQTAGVANLVQVHTSGSQIVTATLREPFIQALAAYDGLLWISAFDDRSGILHGAVYTYDGKNIEEITRLPDNLVAAMTPFQGKLYAGSQTRGKVWTLDQHGLTEVWTVPDVDGIGGASTYAMPIRTMLVDDGRLLLPVVDTNGLGVYAFDPSRGSGQDGGWSNIAAGGAGQQPRHLASFKDDVYASNQASTGARIYKVERKAPTSGTWVSSSFSAGLAATEKVWQKLEVHHAALNANESLTVDYELDGSGVWTNLGVSDTDGTTSKSFSFAAGVKSKRIRLRLQFALTDQTQTPKVTGILVSYLVAQDVKAEWTFDVLLEGSAKAPLVRLDNSNEPTAGPALADALWASRAKKQTLSFTDLDGEAKTVWFVDLEERVSAGATQRLGHQTRGKVTLVEA